MFLLDTNIWMEVIRSRPNAADVRQLLAVVPSTGLFVSDYSVHGIGILLLRHRTIAQYSSIINQAGIGSAISVLSIAVADLNTVAVACLRQSLDFDDAYQYAIAEANKLQIVSYDADFDRTPLGRLTPAAALSLYLPQQP